MPVLNGTLATLADGLQPGQFLCRKCRARVGLVVVNLIAEATLSVSVNSMWEKL